MKLPLWKKGLFAVIAMALLFFATEVGLALFGFQPRLQQEDPFVGFSSRVPLFSQGQDVTGQAVMTTSANKRAFFNLQTFPREKQAGTFRIFCLGGSTTYGRPYSDEMAFSGWLRELLALKDRTRAGPTAPAQGLYLVAVQYPDEYDLPVSGIAPRFGG